MWIIIVWEYKASFKSVKGTLQPFWDSWVHVNVKLNIQEQEMLMQCLYDVGPLAQHKKNTLDHRFIFLLKKLSGIRENTRYWVNVGLLLGQRRRRWPNNKPTLTQCIMFAGADSDMQTRLVDWTRVRTLKRSLLYWVALQPTRDVDAMVG